jgi:hypothetical protein
MSWNNGRTLGPDGRELMYIHFHKLKGDMDTIDFDTLAAPVSFRINRQGFLAG